MFSVTWVICNIRNEVQVFSLSSYAKDRTPSPIIEKVTFQLQL